MMAGDVDDYDFALPEGLIAQRPADERDGGKLLDLSAAGECVLRRFDELPGLLREGDLLVVNDSRVLPARLAGYKLGGGDGSGRGVRGAKVEILAERFFDGGEMTAQIKCGGNVKAGTRLFAAGEFEVLRREGEFFRLRAIGRGGKAVDARRRFLRCGQTPLPPYIRRAADGKDGSRYQTLFARGKANSAAAPTAGLHFSGGVLAAARKRGAKITSITLHIGAGTFKPLREKRLADCKLHSEQYRINKNAAAAVRKTKQNGGRVVAVGTTALRALESSALQNNGEVCAGTAETDLFVKPGFNFRAADLLLTNFHLPRSSLLILACAFGGRARVLDAYRFAVKNKMRFFSYGDAMLLARSPN